MVNKKQELIEAIDKLQESQVVKFNNRVVDLNMSLHRHELRLILKEDYQEWNDDAIDALFESVLNEGKPSREAILKSKITNPKSGRKIQVSTGLSYGKGHPAYPPAKGAFTKAGYSEEEAEKVAKAAQDAKVKNDDKKEDDEDKKQSTASKEQDNSQRIIDSNQQVLDDVDAILEDARVIKMKGGAGSNTPTREEAESLRTFTQERMKQEEARKDFLNKEPKPTEKEIEKYDEENPPYVHPNINRIKVDDKTLDNSLNKIEEELSKEIVDENTGETAFEQWICQNYKGGAVNTHLTNVSKRTVTGKDGKKHKRKDLKKMKGPPPQPGWNRMREVVRLYLENDGKSVVTGKPLKFSNMEIDHREPYGSGQKIVMEEMGLSNEDYNRISGNKKNLSPEDLELREQYDKRYKEESIRLDKPNNHDLMEIGCNQLKGGAEREQLLNKIKKSLLKDPESEKLKNQYKNERTRLLKEHHMGRFGAGDFGVLNERDIDQMDEDELQAVMKSFNYYHPNQKEMKEQIEGNPRKGKEGDPDYYNKLKTFWKSEGVDLPDNPDDIDFNEPPFSKWMNRYVQPKKKRARGGAVSRGPAGNKQFIKDHLRENGQVVLTEEQIEKQDGVVNSGRKKVKRQNAKNQLDWLKRDIQNPAYSDRKKENIQKKIDKLEDFLTQEDE